MRIPTLLAIAGVFPLLAAALGGCGAAGLPSADVPSADAACPSADVPANLDPAFLGSAMEPPADGTVLEVLVAGETGETDLGRLPLLAAFRLAGPEPIEDRDRNLVAIEAGTTGRCAVRVLLTGDAFREPKSLPSLVAIDVEGATISGDPADERGFCTWLRNGDGWAAIECVQQRVTGPAGIRESRVWLRTAWAALDATTALPAWAAETP